MRLRYYVSTMQMAKVKCKYEYRKKKLYNCLKCHFSDANDSKFPNSYSSILLIISNKFEMNHRLSFKN